MFGEASECCREGLLLSLPYTQPTSAWAGDAPAYLTHWRSSSGGTGTAGMLGSLPEQGLQTRKPCLGITGGEVSDQASYCKEGGLFKNHSRNSGGGLGGQALSLAAASGLDHRVLEMEIISRDFPLSGKTTPTPSQKDKSVLF